MEKERGPRDDGGGETCQHAKKKPLTIMQKSARTMGDVSSGPPGGGREAPVPAFASTFRFLLRKSFTETFV